MRLLYLLLVALACLVVPAVSNDPHCYSCANHHLGIYHYDRHCDEDNYSGHTEKCEDGPCDFCMTVIHANGHVERHWAVNPVHFHECKEEADKTTCYCSLLHGEKCNTDMCNHCNLPTAVPPTGIHTDPTTELPTQPPTEPPTQPPTGPPTQPPTEPPTQPPTEPPTQPPTEPPTQPPTGPPTQPPTEPPTQPPTEPLTQPPTQPPTDPTTVPTTNSPITTQPPVVGITCYDCQNYNQDLDNFDGSCSDSDYDGLTYECSNCGSCFTEVSEGGRVTRGEAGAYSDGECNEGVDEVQGSYTICYCTQDQCNSRLCENCA